MGLGRFGGGVGVARWLAAQGADLLITDLDPPDRLTDSIKQVDDLVSRGAVTLRLGEHNVSDFTDTDLVVANPAVPKPWDNRFLRAAEAASVPITTEIRLLIDRLPARDRVIAVTGSVGKSTTSAMIAHILRESGRGVFFGGNIGGSLLASLPPTHARDEVRRVPWSPSERTINEDSWIVLEVSSAMLHWLSADAGFPGAPGWSPHIAVATNISQNHLDWHQDFAHYERSKQQILRDQLPTDHAVISDSLKNWLPSPPHPLISSSPHRFISDSATADAPPLPLPGRHNRLNAAFAIAAAELAGVTREEAHRAIATFPGLPDRLQYLGDFIIKATPGSPTAREGLPTSGAPSTRPAVRAYNDSKSTTPDAARLAVGAMDDDPAIGAMRVRLICGGYDKKIDLTPLAQTAARCAHAYTIGATGRWLAEAIIQDGGRATYCTTLENAVASALLDAKPNDAILLSPGCASWDQFTNYEERGRRFAQLLNEPRP